MQIKPSCVSMAFPKGTGHHKEAGWSGMDSHLRNSSYALSLAASPGEIHPLAALPSPSGHIICQVPRITNTSQTGL